MSQAERVKSFDGIKYQNSLSYYNVLTYLVYRKNFQIFDCQMKNATDYLINENINVEIPKFKDNS